MQPSNPSLSSLKAISNKRDESNEDVLSQHVAGLRQIEKEGYELGIRRARNTFYWIAGLLFVSGLLLAYVRNLLSPAVFAAATLEAILFLGIGLLTYKKPFIAIISGLVLLIGIRVAGSIYDSSGSLSGLVILVVFIALLSRALPDARKWEKMEREEPRSSLP